MTKQIFFLPIFNYTVITLLLVIYLIWNWNKKDMKKNFLLILFCLFHLILVIKVIPSLNSHYLLDSFHSDTVLIKNQDLNISIAIDDLFQGKYGVFSKSENIFDEISNLKKQAFLEILFYKNGKQQLKLKLCEVQNKDEYTFNINGTLFVIIYNGNIIKFNEVFYENIAKKIIISN